MKDGRIVWSISGKDYVHNSVRLVEKEKEGHYGYDSNQKVKVPMHALYKPEIDLSSYLNQKDICIHQSYIGILRWAVELGSLDILREVSKLLSYNVAPQKGHLKAVYHIFQYLKLHENLT